MHLGLLDPCYGGTRVSPDGGFRPDIRLAAELDDCYVYWRPGADR